MLGGLWLVAASNAAGKDERENRVKMIRPPTIRQDGVMEINVTQGDPTQMLCEVAHYSMPDNRHLEIQ